MNATPAQTPDTAIAAVTRTVHIIESADTPASLRNIKHPPARLYMRATERAVFNDLMQRPRVAIVGSRNVTTYGNIITSMLAGELAAHGVVVISGLAIGVDGIAHRSALEAGGMTLAVLPSPLTNIHPKSHAGLAKELIEKGGALVSEYPPGAGIYKENFVARNRIVAGLADALLITEAAENSGTLHTARFALDQGIDVLAVPGNINSPMSEGTNNLIRTGAIPVTSTADVLRALEIEPTGKQGKPVRKRGGNTEEQLLLDLLEKGINQGSDLLERSGFSIEQFNHHLTMLEITAKVRPLGANQWALR